MADTFKLEGVLSTDPATGLSSAMSVIGQLDELLSLTYKHVDDVHLSTDAETAVNFGGGVVSANVVYLKASGGKVTARFTSADGTKQSVPVDSLLFVISQSVPFTALYLQRVPSTDTVVQVFLGQAS